jgi:hypothetical protein
MQMNGVLFVIMVGIPIMLESYADSLVTLVVHRQASVRLLMDKVLDVSGWMTFDVKEMNTILVHARLLVGEDTFVAIMKTSVLFVSKITFKKVFEHVSVHDHCLIEKHNCSRRITLSFFIDIILKWHIVSSFYKKGKKINNGFFLGY